MANGDLSAGPAPGQPLYRRMVVPASLVHHVECFFHLTRSGTADNVSRVPRLAYRPPGTGPARSLLGGKRPSNS
jgi:hypothetical protein